MRGQKLLLLQIAFFLCLQNLLSQREASIWYFGNKAGLDFNSGTPTPLLDGSMETHEGCSTISDRNGNLLFYTDGVNVWDKSHKLMPNGTGLLGHESSTQSAIIVPRAGSNNTQYYIFTTDDPDPEDTPNHGLNYSLVDLTLNNGFGDVVPIEKNVHLITYNPENDLENKFKCSEKITAIQHNDESSIWVITHFVDSFYAFKVDSNGVTKTPVISTTGTKAPVDGYKQNGVGYLKVSPNGKKVGIAHSQTSYSEQTGPKTQNKQTGKVLLYDFNSSTGRITNEISLLSNIIPYGIEFSPKATKLYVSINIYDNDGDPNGSSLLQYDLLSNNIIGSKEEIITSSNTAGALQLAMDGKIYRAGYPISGSGTALSVINDPEAKGVSCNYQSSTISLGGRTSELGLPPFVQSFFIFKFEYKNVCLGDETEFTILDDAPFDSIKWDFGDGETSTEESPKHIYQQPGNYLVTLTKYIGGNAMEPLTKEITIFDVPSVPSEIVEYYQCAENENSNGIATFNLNLINPIVSLDIHQVTNVYYYSDLATAQQDISNSNSLANIYTNSSADEVLVAKVHNPISDCYAYAQVSLKVKNALNINGPVLPGCDIGNGTAEFNLYDYALLIKDLYNLSDNAGIRFYSNQNDALLGRENYLPDSYISPNRILYMRLDQENICYGLGQFSLNVQRMEVPFQENKVYLCADNDKIEPVELFSGVSTNNQDNYSFLWSTGESTPSIKVNRPGTYTVTITNSIGCSVERKIVVFAVEPPKITDVLISNDRVEIITDSNGSYEYAIGDIYGPYQTSNVFMDVQTGTTNIYVRNLENCGVASKELFILNYPKFFTPNGDLKNDLWQLNFNGIDAFSLVESPIFIFDRYGKLLTQLDPLANGWDGTFNGKPLVSSDYWFKVTLSSGKELKGHFALRR